MKATAIVLAAGKGQRMGSDTPKQYMELAGKPLLSYSLKAFEESGVAEVLIVAGKDDPDMIRSKIVQPFGFAKVAAVIEGGPERYHSVCNGLTYLAEHSWPDAVLIHDGARPFVTVDVINRMLEYLQGGSETDSANDALIAGMPVKDTIKIADETGAICGTTERKYTWMAQTPQAFRFEKILHAYQTVIGNAPDSALSHITDDAMVFSLIYPDIPVMLLEAGYRNLKITTPEDMKIAELFVAEK